MKRLSDKAVNIIKQELETTLKKEVVKIIHNDHMTSILFFPVSRIPPDITNIRAELGGKGVLLFYSSVLEGKGKQEMLSFNISKL